MRDLHDDPMAVRRRYAEKAVDAAVVEGVTQHGDDFALQVTETPPGEGEGALVTDGATPADAVPEETMASSGGPGQAQP